MMKMSEFPLILEADPSGEGCRVIIEIGAGMGFKEGTELMEKMLEARRMKLLQEAEREARSQR